MLCVLCGADDNLPELPGIDVCEIEIDMINIRQNRVCARVCLLCRQNTLVHLTEHITYILRDPRTNNNPFKDRAV